MAAGMRAGNFAEGNPLTAEVSCLDYLLSLFMLLYSYLFYTSLYIYKFYVIKLMYAVGQYVLRDSEYFLNT